MENGHDTGDNTKKGPTPEEKLPPPPPPPEEERAPVEPTVQTSPNEPLATPKPVAYQRPPSREEPPPYYPQQQMPQYQQPSTYPPPPPQYAPAQPYSSPIYSWQLMPFRSRELMGDDRDKRWIFVIIGALLIITASLQFPIAGFLAFYGTSDSVEFGGTFNLHGTVRDSEGTNLSGARISIVGTSLVAFSDESGEYTIFDAPNGILRIEAQLAGFRIETRKVLVHEFLFSDVDFVLKSGDGSEEVNDLWFFITLAILTLMFSIFVLAGAVYSFKGLRFPVVLVGAILGLFIMSPILAFWFLPLLFLLGLIGFFTSTAALLLIVRHRGDFREWSSLEDESEVLH